MYLVAAVLCFGVGVVLTVMPGPGFVFFAFAGALVATQSTTVARFLDSAEVRVRAVLHAHRK